MTLEDVAAEAGVHYSTVSRALDPEKASRVNPATRKHVQAIARRLGYVQDVRASALKRGRSQMVAVVVGDITNPNVAPVLRGLAAALEARGLMPLISETHEDRERLEQILNQLMGRRVDAILLIAATRDHDGPVLRRIRRRGVPIILAVQAVRGMRLPLCCYDDNMGGRLVAEHLLSLGHRRLAQLRGPSDITSIVERCRGFSETVAAAGATEVTVEGTAPEGSIEDGRRLMRKLLERSKSIPTGIFAHHDMMAIGALSVAREFGLRCPEDLSIVGYHDLPYVEHIVPSLTSIRLPREDLGRISAQLMLHLLDAGQQGPATRKLAPLLVVRNSTGPAPKRR